MLDDAPTLRPGKASTSSNVTWNVGSNVEARARARPERIDVEAPGEMGGWLATMPTGRPFRRPKPIRSEKPPYLDSKRYRSSARPMISLMS